MNQGKPITRYFIFSCLALLFILPLVQGKFGIIKLSPLKGAFVPAVEDTFSSKKWFSGEYQNHTEKYLNQAFGFRNLLVRINNQLDFSIFNNTNLNSVIPGKNNYLFTYEYIKAYRGYDYTGEKIANEDMRQLKFIQTELALMNKTLIVIFAPGKASYYPEYLPDSCSKEGDHTNYKLYPELVEKWGINNVNFRKYFLDQKKQSAYPLFSKNGTHWSEYAACLVMDSLISYIDNMRNITMPHFKWNNIAESDQDTGFDNDIVNAMNMMYNPIHEKMGYPQTSIIAEPDNIKPSILAVGDSYFGTLWYLNINKVFSGYHFSYYNQKMFPESFDHEINTDQFSLKKEIADHDVIVIEATESNLNALGWGFIGNLYDMLRGDSHRFDPTSNLIVNQEKYIRSDKNWMAEIEKKARQNHISTDSMIILDAIWAKRNEFDSKVQKAYNEIKNNIALIHRLEIKAKEKNTSVDTIIRREAICVADKDYDKMR